MASPDVDLQGHSTLADVVEHLPGSHSPSADPKESNQLSLSQAIHARRSEYVRPKTIRIKVGTWNTAAFKDTELDLGGWFVGGQGVSINLNRPRGINNGDDSGEGSQTHSRPSSSGDSGKLRDASSTTKPVDGESNEPLHLQEVRHHSGHPSIPKHDPGAVAGGDQIGLYLLGLQEIVDVGSASENFRPYTESEPAKRWKASMESALPKGYVLVAEQQLIGLLLLIYASPDVAPDVKAISTTSVGTGLMGYLGNKGAVTARIVLGDTTRLVFVNSHLAAGADKASLDRRNWDYSQIMSRTKFEPIRDAMDLHQSSGEVIDDADFAFWTGDLNYRLADIPAEDVRRLLTLHTKNEYDVSHPSRSHSVKGHRASLKKKLKRLSIDSLGSSSKVSVNSFTSDDSRHTDLSDALSEDETLDEASDPASLQTTLDSLLPHDELYAQIKSRKAFHEGWREGPIHFLPTYKYDRGSVGVFDSSEKRRGPSWCDRILYRTRTDKLAYDKSAAEALEASKRDEEMKRHGIDQAAKEEELLYDYDPDEDGAEEDVANDEIVDQPEGVVITKGGFQDELHLESYTAHQRILTSDHKPLDAVFLLKYDHVIPKLRSKVHDEVARELDKAENEGRPAVTVIVDKHHEQAASRDSDQSQFEGVNFGHVKYAKKKRRSLTIANTGRVDATITFIDRPMESGQDHGPAPKWIKIDMDPDEDRPKHYTGPVTLEPGEVCNVDVKMRVRDRHLTNALNDGTTVLDDVLVLRVEGGRDHFIPIHGKWMPSSIGRSIDKLIRIPEGGIRKWQHQKPKGHHKHHPRIEDFPIKWSAPRELFRLTETTEKLTEACIAEWEMTSGDKEAPWVTVAGWPFAEASWTSTCGEERHDLMGAVSEALDTGVDINECMPPDTPKMAMLETVASFLIEFLESMPDGIITPFVWEKLQVALHKHENDKHIDHDLLRTQLEEILSTSPPHSISFILLSSTIERIIGEQVSSTLRNKEDFKVPPPLTRSITGSLRKKDLNKDPKGAYRQIIVRAMAEVFSHAVIRTREPEKQKEKTALEQQKISFIELFISKGTV